MSGESVKVAVRVRPFNQREKDRQAKLVIEMMGSMTTIRNPDSKKDEPKKFTFDYSYWSHDGFTTNENGVLEADSSNSKYASQQSVYQDLGRGVLNNALEGYNCSLFAYGQTGSGKSYSLIGYGPNKGIVPITCDELFKTISANKDLKKRFQVTFSMLEIYNEQVRDLLSKSSEYVKGGLQVRQSPQHGSFYVQGLKFVPVGSYEEIDKRMIQGTANRTVASTNMNATSSRAHTLVSITFDQFIGTQDKDETKKSSVMNLVDLAGSERADSTGATGDRLKEGANINRSLSALGNVISALADISSGSKRKIVVPYRDSVLTKLLQNALGGNSKTVMIAALSPADINFDETLSTLRYADRAKRIKNKAVINEDPMERLIRQLKEENEMLKEQIKSGKLVEHVQITKEMSSQEIEKLKKEMMEEALEKVKSNQEVLKAQSSQNEWSKKLELARSESILESKNETRKKNEPYLLNVNEDSQLSYVVFHFLHFPLTRVGRNEFNPPPHICLKGLSIQQHHADIMVSENNKTKTFELRPQKGAKVKLNGQNVSIPTTIKHKDRILFGSNHLYIFVDPLFSSPSDSLMNWEEAQMEIAQAQGFTTSDLTSLSKDKQITQEQVLQILPLVSEVNALSEEMERYKSFDVVLLSLDAHEGIKDRSTNVMVQVRDLLTKNVWLWERGKFVNRRFIMQDMYQSMLDGEIDLTTIAKEDDPFWEEVEDALVGTGNIFLQSLAYNLDFKDKIPVRNFKGNDEGWLQVQLQPCSSSGKNLSDEAYVENPQQLINKPFHFKVILRDLELYNSRYKHGLYVKYNMKGEQQVITEKVKGKNKVNFHHSFIITFPSLSKHHIYFFENASIIFFVYAVQVNLPPDSCLRSKSTKELRQLESMENLDEKEKNERRRSMNSKEPAVSQMKSELILLQRKCERLDMKEKKLQETCRVWEQKIRKIMETDKNLNEEEIKERFVKFFEEINNLAFSNGLRFKAKAKMIAKMLADKKQHSLEFLEEENGGDDEDVEVYVFGEEEKKMRKMSHKGYVKCDDLIKYYGNNANHLLESKRNQIRRKSIIHGKPLPGKLKNKKSKLGHQKNNENKINKVTKGGENYKSDENSQLSSACIVQ